jgi:uncharacterized protein YbjT (DUF2867 family)
MTKLITVFGATGNQGGSVIAHILDHAELSKAYKIRGVTRDVSKPAAKALTDKGVEMVAVSMPISGRAELTLNQGNIDDPTAIAKAVDGSSVVFGVTNCMPPPRNLYE